MFASDNISGVAAGPEHAGATSQLQRGLGAPGGSHEFRAQFPVIRFPTARALSEEPAQRNQRGQARLRMWHAPEFIRRVLPSVVERRSPLHGPLTGQPNDRELDPEGRGVVRGIPGTPQYGVGMRNAHDHADVLDYDPQPVAGVTEDLRDLAPDITRHVQSPHSEEHETLRSVRASFPGISVSPIPQTRAIILAAAGAPVELPLPSGAVLTRITWSGMTAGVDLLISFSGGVNATLTQAAGNGSPDALAGLILNPDFTSYYYTLGKLALSAMVPQGSLNFVNPCVVNVQCYLNN